jgi:hypothetical protein
MKWVTRARPKTDRIACPWLIRRFIDPDADIDGQLDTDPAGPGLLAIGLGGLDVEADDLRLLDRATFVYDALYAWCGRQLS